MKRAFWKKWFGLLLVVLLVPASTVSAQGLKGGLPSPQRLGVSAGGPLIPGKTDAERWKFVQVNLPSLIGKDKAETTKLFGKKGGPELEKDEVVYQITNALPRKSGGLNCINLLLHFDEKDVVHKVSIVRVTWL